MKRRDFLKHAGLLVAGAALGSGAGILSGCTTPAARPGGSKGPVDITYWHRGGGPAADVMKDLQNMFNESQSQVRVTIEMIPPEGVGINQKLLSAVSAGTPPDCAYLDRGGMLSSWAVRGALVPLDSYADADKVTEQSYYAYTWDQVRNDGKLYGLPLEANPITLLFWRKDMFEKAGLDPDKVPATMDELDVMVEKLYKKSNDNTYDVIGFVPWFKTGFMVPIGNSFGAQWYDRASQKVLGNGPNNVRALDWMASYAKKYGIETLSRTTQAFGGAGQDPFITGQVAMITGHVSTIANMKRYGPDVKYGVGMLPVPAGGRKSIYMAGESAVIPKGSKHPDEAWQFIKWLTSGEAIKKWCVSMGYFPAHTEVSKDPVFADSPEKQQVISFMEHGTTNTPMPVGDFYWTKLQEAVDFTLHSKKTAQQALDDAVRETQERLEATLKGQ